MKLDCSKKGFSLVELTIVVVILGILATFAVPRFMTSVEKTKASEGLSYLHQVEQQQSRYMAWHGRYAKSTKELRADMGETLASPSFFDTTAFSSSDWEERWSTRLIRNSASSGFGRYTIAWGQDGFIKSKSSIPTALKPDGGGTAPVSSGKIPSGSGSSSSGGGDSTAGSGSGSDSDSGSTSGGSTDSGSGSGSGESTDSDSGSGSTSGGSTDSGSGGSDEGKGEDDDKGKDDKKDKEDDKGKGKGKGKDKD